MGARPVPPAAAVFMSAASSNSATTRGRRWLASNQRSISCRHAVRLAGSSMGVSLSRAGKRLPRFLTKAGAAQKTTGGSPSRWLNAFTVTSELCSLLEVRPWRSRYLKSTFLTS